MSLGDYQKQARLMGILYGLMVGMEATGKPITYTMLKNEMKPYCNGAELAQTCQTLKHLNEVIESAQLFNVLEAAKDRVIHDMPYVEVVDARLHEYHAESRRWYALVEVKHLEEDQGEASVLCRVWIEKETGEFKATRVSVE